MMTRIVNLSKRNGFFQIIILFTCRLALKVMSFFWEAGRFFRKLGISLTKHKRNKVFKNIHKDKRCFIICTGPSLTVDDLDMLKNEITFAMNSILLLYEKTKFRPTYYGVIDEGVFLKLQNDIVKYGAESNAVFVSRRCTKHIKYGTLPYNWYEIPINVAYHTYDRWFKNKFWAKFSDDAYEGVYDMYSVTHFLIQIAVYMGFKEIYLIGADCNQRVGKQIHFIEYGVPDASLDTARERNICGYMEIKKYCDMHDVTVYNATRGGELEIFERRKLDDILTV